MFKYITLLLIIFFFIAIFFGLTEFVRLSKIRSDLQKSKIQNREEIINITPAISASDSGILSPFPESQ